MERQTFTIIFFIRRTKLLKNNEAPIFLRITFNGERAETSIQRSINPDQWNSKKGYAKPTTQFGMELNHYLDQIRHQVYQHQQDFREKGKQVTALSLRNAYLKVESEEKRFVLQVYQEHNEDLKSRINKGISRATFIRHQSSRNKLERFIKALYKRNYYYLKVIVLLRMIVLKNEILFHLREFFGVYIIYN
jgi:hypothetical protein